MSLPTLNDRLAKVFEPNAPGVARRLDTLNAAKAAGLHVYVAVAPTYPDCDESDLRSTLRAVKELDPLTVFHEPINIRADNVARIRRHAQNLGLSVDLEPFASRETWWAYAASQLRLVEHLAGEAGIVDRLHLWPDQDLAQRRRLQSLADPTGEVYWLNRWWTRISEWPG